MDDTTFEAFYEKVRRPLWSYIYRVSGRATLADDLLQESFIRFLGSSLSSNDEAERRAYLYKIATNLIYDHWRREKRERLWTLRFSPPTEAYDDTALDTNDSETFAALRKMKPQERVILWLAHVEGYKHREIAEVLGLSEKSIRVLLFRARQKMEKLLKQ